MSTEPTLLCLDLGKTSCRAVIIRARVVLASSELDGVRADADGGALAVDRLIAAVRLLPAHHARAVQACGVGAAGVLTDPVAGDTIAAAVHERLGVPVAVASDVVTAHLGAFDGAPGTILVAGTGAVAVRIDAAGEMRRVDGWGPDIGDLGSGSWIGREGLRAVLGAGSGLRPPTELSARLASLTLGRDPVRWVAESENSARQLARFAPLVLEAAEQADTVAVGIADQAARLLSATAAAAAAATPAATARDDSAKTADSETVAVLGGLSLHPWFNARLSDAITSAGLTAIHPHSDALWGASLAALRTDLPHERHIHRAR
ncbi:N-acetylglucosamine kinase [Glaciibacter superstes]|uniref:N-acetylglucosamine kinase n=1 Tax=Glaciibacter superstes TaxID=501023 RepID=UPI0003B649E5|nr:BadF/BadG/BcrA/BcrD ATPase family protein [Glaciibacter superstes]